MIKSKSEYTNCNRTLFLPFFLYQPVSYQVSDGFGAAGITELFDQGIKLFKQFIIKGYSESRNL